jgi:ABC-type multidrug transport system permease subunit
MRKDLRYMLRQKETLMWVFFMPIVFFFFIGNITGGFGGSPSEKTPLVVQTDPGAGFLADHFLDQLEARGYRLVSPDSVEEGSSWARLEIQEGFTDSILAGETTTLRLTREKPGLGADYDEIRIQRSILAILGDVIRASQDGRVPDDAALVEAAATPRTLSLEVSRAGRRREIPSGFEQAIPGTMVMFTLMILFTSGSILLVIERRDGLLRRLASAPIGRGSVLLGKWGSRLFLGIIQIAFAMLTGTVLFKMDWGPNLPMLFLVLVVYGGLGALLGILLGNLARTEGQAVGIGVLTTNIIAPLGGCWWPIEITPEWMQKLALVFPTGWAMDALHKLVSFEAPPSSVVPHIAVMLVASLVVGWLAARTFRFQ